MQVIVYTFQDAGGNDFGTFQTQDYQEAVRYARESKLRVIANTLVYDDSELVDDFTDSEDADADAERFTCPWCDHEVGVEGYCEHCDPSEGDECPNCHTGTVTKGEDGELSCAGACGAVLRKGEA